MADAFSEIDAPSLAGVPLKAADEVGDWKELKRLPQPLRQRSPR
jgi:hypothetical protein